MATKLSLWERALKLFLSDKTFMLRSLKKERGRIETRAEQFALEVSNVELAIGSVIEDLRTIQQRQVANEDRKLALDIKIEGVGAEFQALQNKKKLEAAREKSDLLEELIDEQVGLEKTMADNSHRIETQNKNLKRMRRELTEMKEKLRNTEDAKNELIARYNTVEAMNKAQATMALLESGSHVDDMKSFENKVRSGEAIVEGRREARDSSEVRQFELLERDEAVSARLKAVTMKGIQ